MSSYTHDQGQSFKKLPEISNLEICSACNLECPMCLRTTHLGRQPGLVDMKLLKLMHRRGDFEGTFYTELQMAGEPTLHPQLFDIVHYLQNSVKILVGLSTHGLQIEKKNDILLALSELDALTISVDSVDPETYHKMRFPAHIEDLYRNLKLFFELIAAKVNNHKKIPLIELQLVKTPLIEKSGDLPALQAMMKEKGWDKYAVVRTIYDCFEGMQDRLVNINTTRELCLNPFTSVSIAHNGDVVSCCMIFTPDPKEINYYGNVYDESLQKIWEGHRVEEMRKEHLSSACEGGPLSGQCAKCTVRSPCQIHTQIVARLVQSRGV